MGTKVGRGVIAIGVGSEFVDTWSDWVATNSEDGVTEVERGDSVAEWLELESSDAIAIVLYCCDRDCAIQFTFAVCVTSRNCKFSKREYGPLNPSLSILLELNAVRVRRRMAGLRPVGKWVGG